MAIAKTEFLWYKRKDIIKESDPVLLKDWASKGFISLDEQAEKQPELDLNHDGKVNDEDKNIAQKLVDSFKQKKVVKKK